MWLFVILFPTFGGKKSRFLRMVHPYSGLDPDAWKQFQNHMEMYENQKLPIDQRARGLYASIEDVRNLGLSVRLADDHETQEHLETLANDIGIEGESTLFQLAQKQGVYFFPKYLNNLVSEESEDVNRTGAAIGDHFPDPRSHGQ